MQDTICNKCAHRQNYDGYDRCARYHDSLCDKMIETCKGDLFLDMSEGVSLYAMRNWLDRLSKEELELPLVFELMYELEYRRVLPMLVLRYYDAHGDKWVFYGERKDV